MRKANNADVNIPPNYNNLKYERPANGPYSAQPYVANCVAR